MNKIYLFVCGVALLLFSSFASNLECEYAGSNLGFALSQTEKAIEIDDINKARFFAYKALNAIEKSKKQLKLCGCEYAKEAIEEGLEDLKNATKATSLNSTRIFLSRSLEHTVGSLEALQEHHLHNSRYAGDVLALNSTDKKKKTSFKALDTNELHEKIDISLEKYETSLNNVVETVDCNKAKEFALRIFKNCEKQLLKENLSEGKKYYNLRTKEITEDALKRIGDCTNKI